MVSEKTRFPQHAAQIVRIDLDIYSEHFEFCAGSALSLDYGYPQFLFSRKNPWFLFGYSLIQTIILTKYRIKIKLIYMLKKYQDQTLNCHISAFLDI